MNYLEEQTDGEAMINSIKNGDQPLPRVTQVFIFGTSSTKQPPLKDKSMWSDQEKRIQKIDRLARSLLILGLPNDIYSLIGSNKTAKDLCDALARHMLGSEYGEKDRKAAVLYEYETFKATKRELLLDTYIRYLQVINDLKKCGYSKDNYELNFKFLNNLKPEWKQYATMMRQNKNLMDINIDALYNILKQNQRDVNDAMGSKKKIIVVTSDPLALIAEKIKVCKSKEKVIVSSDFEGSDADDFSELKKITALLAKAFNRRKFYSKPTNNNLRTSSTSQSANKKQEFVKNDNKKVEKKDDEKKRNLSRVKCYNCKKEGHFAKDCKKAEVKDYEYYKTKMLLAKKDKDKQVLLAEDQAWMESSKASSSSADEKIFEVSYYLSESKSEFEFKTSEYYDNSTNYGLFVNNDDDQEIFHDAIESASENFIENLGYSQQEGIDYDETFAPAARIEAIRLFLAYAAHKDFTVFQMDVNTSFLKGIIKEKVYVAQPPGFVSKQYPDHVYALDKALYGLKQAPRAWYDVLSQFLIDSGFQKGSIDTALFIKNKDLMVKHFEMSVMGEMKFFLGLQLNQFSNGIFKNQSKYILDIWKRFGMENCDTVSTPMVEQAKLKLDLVGKPVDHTDYQSMIGSLMYVTSSRPDIMFATCMYARYQANPNEYHVGYSQQERIDYDETFALVTQIEAIHLFLAYAAHKDFANYQMDVKTAFLNGILKEEVYVGQPLGFVSEQYPDHVYALDKALYGLKQAPRACMDNCDTIPTPMVEQTKLKLDLVGKPVDHTDYRSMIGSLMYVTSSRPDIMFATYHARYHLDRKSTSGSVQFLGDKLMRTQLADYDFFYGKVPIYYDSKSAIAISYNPVQHTRTKHIDVSMKPGLLRKEGVRFSASIFEKEDKSSLT
nr:hypothetical protein [Tanacetum cinerariifolium]